MFEDDLNDQKKEEEERKKGREEKKKKTDYLSAPPEGWPAGPLGPVPLAQCCCTTFLEGPFGRIQKFGCICFYFFDFF